MNAQRIGILQQALTPTAMLRTYVCDRSYELSPPSNGPAGPNLCYFGFMIMSTGIETTLMVGLMVAKYGIDKAIRKIGLFLTKKYRI